MEEELEFIEWLRVLKLPEDDFRRHIRGYFDDTMEMEQYIATRRPQVVVQEYPPVSSVPTMPAPVVFTAEQPAVQAKPGKYKGKRRKK